MALNLLQDEPQADGVVQDTFLTLLEQIDRFEGHLQVRTWLYRVAYNACLGRLRAAKPFAGGAVQCLRQRPAFGCAVFGPSLPQAIKPGAGK